MLPPERRALSLLLALAIAGQAVRHFGTRPGQAAGGVEILSTLPPASPAAQRDSTLLQARPLAPGERIDADAAGAAELSRLPRVGPRLAKTIVADREANGPFGSLAALDRVAGVGPGLLRTLEPFLTFSGPADAAFGTSFAPPAPGASVAPEPDSQGTPLNVNRATAVELERLPGIGPSLARRIVADREARGPFATIPELDRVPGIGPALVGRLGGRVTVR